MCVVARRLHAMEACMVRMLFRGVPAAVCLSVLVRLGSVDVVFAQGLGGAGTVQGTVKDPTGGVMQAVEVRISNKVSGFTRSTSTDAAGKYTFSNLPPN